MDVRYGRLRFESEAETLEGAREALARFAEVCKSMGATIRKISKETGND